MRTSNNTIPKNNRTVDNNAFAIVKVSRSADSFVVKESAGLRLTIIADKTAHHLQNVSSNPMATF